MHEVYYEHIAKAGKISIVKCEYNVQWEDFYFKNMIFT